MTSVGLKSSALCKTIPHHSLVYGDQHVDNLYSTSRQDVGDDAMDWLDHYKQMKYLREGG